MAVDHRREAARRSAAIAEAMNALGVCLCKSAVGALEPAELDRFLKHVSRDHLPVLLAVVPARADLVNRPNLARRILAGLDRDRRTIAEIAERGLQEASASDAREFRQAIRSVLVAVGVPLPAPAEGPCELHGADCPEPNADWPKPSEE